MSIYHWKLGDVALARVCLKVYAKVQVVKDENGLFYDDKVLGITANEDGSITATEELCYYVEICRTKERLWLPYTSLRLANRSRPFYGPADKPQIQKPFNKSPKKLQKTTRVVHYSQSRKISPSPGESAVGTCDQQQLLTDEMKTLRNCIKWDTTLVMILARKIKEDHIVPLSVKISKLKEPDLNTTYDMRHVPLKQGKYENAFNEFMRRGKEMLFDTFFVYLQTNKERDEDCLDYLLNVDASTEDKFEMVFKNIVTEKEIESYLHQCWRYNFVHKQSNSKDSTDAMNTSPEKQAITLHAPWCLVCGQADRLRECLNCPSSFHLACRREWLVTIRHRKNPPKQAQKQTLVKKILSSTRIISSVRKDKENVELCPSCMWGPRVGYEDVVWHKLGSCSWWPARVLPPGAAPACLLARKHAPRHWPLQYYGVLSYAWGDSSRMCLFLPSHTAALQARDPDLRRAVLDACDDYIAVYLK